MRKVRIAVAAVVIMCVLIFPSDISLAASCGETVSKDTEAVLKAVDYESDDQIAALLAPSRYFSYEVTNKKLEIANRDGRNFIEISDDEAKKELNRENVRVMSFEESFEEMQGQIGTIIQKVVDNTAGAEDKGAEYYTKKIVENKEKLLLGLAYIDRLYDFNMGEKNIRDVLLYEPETYGTQIDVLDWLIKIGGAGGDTLKVSNSANVFGYDKLFWDVTGYSAMNLGSFLEINRQKWIPDTSMDEWFLNESRAFIVEKPSSWNSSANTGLYSRLYGDSALQSHILPLLTVSEDSIYVIATAATITYGIVDCYVDRELKDTAPDLYEEKREQFRQDLEHVAGQQREFLDLWYRIAEPEVRGQLSSNRIVKDSLRIYANPTVNAQTEWSAKFGKDAAKGVREFFAPLNLYAPYMMADGMADGEGVRYYLSKALTERGLATYAHELTHLLVSKVMLNGYAARDGMQSEVYTRGMFEPYESNDPPAFNLNLIYDRLTYNERLHNAVPDRFQDETDMQDYMSGLLDVVYTLDYAEAEVMLSKTPEEKKKWFHKLEQIEDTKTRTNQGEDGSKHYLDSVRELTLDEAEELNTIEDLIRNSIIVSRYEVNGLKTTGTMDSNGYYVVPLFSANYAGVQNDSGVSGDVMIRRQAFELLAEYGYDNGMVPYISNQYKEAAKADQTILSDTYILKKIFGKTYNTMADFKNAMFQKRIDKVGELKPVTISWKNQSVTISSFQILQQLMREAVESDLVNVNVTSDGFNNIRAQKTQVERLKAEIFRAYLFQTKDFKESIYADGQESEDPTEGTTEDPTEESTEDSTEKPTEDSTENPTEDTTEKPTEAPTENPTEDMTEKPTEAPAEKPTVDPTEKPTVTPTVEPTGEEGHGISGEKAKNPELLLAWVSSTKTSQTIRWKSVSLADGYYIYGAKATAKYKRLKTVSKKVCKWKHKKLKKGTQYKYRVEAYKIIEGKRVIISNSVPAYSTTKGGKYGNPVKLKVKKSSLSVKRGKKIKLKVKVTGKKLNKARKKIRYISADPSIAKVSKTGAITGVKRGTCYIYCVAQNGLFKKIRVRVK
ncbi:MAG: Ig-like domain-containing protein [Lachnospiraceae bacterium]|nr:Ig-like domain-containing protein [Lachnospiraceae bacterium]